MPATSAAGSENGAETPIEIGRRTLRILLVLFIANIAALIAAFVLAALYVRSLMEGRLISALGVSFGILAVAIVGAPALAFLVHTTRSKASVTPPLRNSALASAVAPAVVGVWCATADEGVGLVILGAVLILLAAAVIIRAFTASRADAGANRFVLRPGASFVGIAIVALAATGRPHGPPPAEVYARTMKSDLRNLVTAQQIHFDRTQRYHSDPAILRFVPSTATHVPTITLSDSGWSATNKHSRLQGIRCGIAIGTTNPINPVAKDGEPACDSLRKR